MDPSGVYQVASVTEQFALATVNSTTAIAAVSFWTKGRALLVVGLMVGVCFLLGYLIGKSREEETDFEFSKPLNPKP